ncbi:TrkA family potassium uptake protein [bacterium]|nr:TrkA family potassium uptake protein [bacterium]
MYIVIAGGGMVGGTLARKLVCNKHDVIVIDKDKELCDSLYADTGAITIHGNTSNTDTLEEAEIKKADVFVAATGNDTDNLASSILARSFGVPEIIVRVRNSAYEKAYKLAGVTSMINLADLVINQMIVQIEKPKVKKIMTIAGGKADIYSVVVPQKAYIAGKKIEVIGKDPNFPPKCIFISMYNKSTDELLIPRGKHIINEGDELFLISAADDIGKVADFLTRAKK